VLRAEADGVAQVVILAAGMDARAFDCHGIATPLFTKLTNPT
jgi:O-methyltransferase involved in polyketide biosynthesis